MNHRPKCKTPKYKASISKQEEISVTLSKAKCFRYNIKITNHNEVNKLDFIKIKSSCHQKTQLRA